MFNPQKITIDPFQILIGIKGGGFFMNYISSSSILYAKY